MILNRVEKSKYPACKRGIIKYSSFCNATLLSFILMKQSVSVRRRFDTQKVSPPPFPCQIMSVTLTQNEIMWSLLVV